MTITEAKSIMIQQRNAFLDEYVDYGRVKEAYNMAIKALEQPERKKVEWFHLGGDKWCCPACGFVISTEGSWEHPLETGNNFCKNCGADMRGEQE